MTGVRLRFVSNGSQNIENSKPIVHPHELPPTLRGHDNITQAVKAENEIVNMAASLPSIPRVVFTILEPISL